MVPDTKSSLNICWWIMCLKTMTVVSVMISHVRCGVYLWKYISLHSILNTSLQGRKWTPIILYDTECSQSFTLTNREMISFSSFLYPFLHFCWEPHFKSPEHSREGIFHRKRGRQETWKVVRAYFSFPRTTSQSSPLCFLSSFLTLLDLSCPSNRKHLSVCSVLGAKW